MDSMTRRVHVFWDWENCPLKSDVTLSSTLIGMNKYFEENLGLISSFHVFLPQSEVVGSNRERPNRLKLMQNAGISTEIVTSSKPQAADIVLIVKIFEAAMRDQQQNRTSTYVLISGDSDYTSAIWSLKRLGHTVIMIPLLRSASDTAMAASDRVIFWDVLVHQVVSSASSAVVQQDIVDSVESLETGQDDDDVESIVSCAEEQREALFISILREEGGDLQFVKASLLGIRWKKKVVGKEENSSEEKVSPLMQSLVSKGILEATGSKGDYSIRIKQRGSHT